MPGIIGRRRKTRARAGRPATEKRPTPIKVQTVSAATTALTVTFDQPVTLKGVPQYAVSPAGPTPVSAQVLSPTSIAITYSATIASITSVTIPFEDPAVRNPAGGYVQPYDAYALG